MRRVISFIDCLSAVRNSDDEGIEEEQEEEEEDDGEEEIEDDKTSRLRIKNR